MKGLQKLYVTAKEIDATLDRVRRAERTEYKLQWRDRMDRGLYAEARELTGRHFMRGTLTKDEALADVEAVKIALELNEHRLRN